MGKNFFDLVCRALPLDLNPQDLLSFINNDWWTRNPRLATAFVLRNHPRIDWKAYLRKYEDVRESGMDPCLHFLEHGIFEGRKIFSRHPLYQGDGREPAGSAITIAITVPESLLYFDRCLRSAFDQTLRNLEIIIAPWAPEQKLPELP